MHQAVLQYNVVWRLTVITIRIPVETGVEFTAGLRSSIPDPSKVKWYEAEYGDDGRFCHMQSEDGTIVHLQWATPVGTNGVSVIEQDSYGKPLKIATIAMVCFPDLGIMVPECLFCRMPPEVDRRNMLSDKRS